MPGSLSPTELGVAAIVLLLVLRDVLKFLKDVVIPKLSGNSTNAERIRQETLNDMTIKQIASAMEKQTMILQGLSFVVTTHDKEFHEFVKDFHEHMHEILEHKN